ncbi:hypothetical protein [Methanobrevibacter sp.]|uniref:hypothetical protein n=1 Tax=Methanobrevibacter sp. TaxID=66852 RepID=UPI0025F727E3|nr:hypothetical protein [Methanobrevibacter sp.]MBQ2666191.1 hypothetical protein [Methanobrevibacter sp.]
MNRKGIILLAVLMIFIVGMVLAPASAAKNVKVGDYKGKLTTKQYKTLKNAYKKDKKFTSVTIKCTNKKYHKISIQYMNGLCQQNGKFYIKGFYGSVWDTRYGMDGIKLVDFRVNI